MNYNQNLKIIFRLTLTILLTLGCNKKTESEKNKKNEYNSSYKIYSISIPNSLVFSGETVDMIVTLKDNFWGGERTIQVQIEDVIKS